MILVGVGEGNAEKPGRDLPHSRLADARNARYDDNGRSELGSVRHGILISLRTDASLSPFPIYLAMRLLLAAVLLFSSAACGSDTADAPPSVPEFRVDGVLDFVASDGTPVKRIAIEIADTDSSREMGLMNRPSMAEQAGMLFIMEREEPQGFWMRNTLMPLDLFFADDSLNIVAIRPDNRSVSDARIESGVPARYVVETRAGFAARHGITEGYRIRWRRQ